MKKFVLPAALVAWAGVPGTVQASTATGFSEAADPGSEERLAAHDLVQAILPPKSRQEIFGKMIDAYIAAFLRRFDAAEMREMTVFFSSDIGKKYCSLTGDIFSDPSIAAWQREYMANSQQDMDGEMETFFADIKDLIETQESAENANKS